MTRSSTFHPLILGLTMTRVTSVRIVSAIVLLILSCDGSAHAQGLYKLTASDGVTGDWYGRAVAVSGNLVLVGAPSEDDGGIWAGAAYLNDATTGAELLKLTASDAGYGHHFGTSVAIDGN